mgnify:CR=1 FL=1
MSREGSTFSSSVSILSCERVFAHKARDIRPARQFSSASEAPRGARIFIRPITGYPTPAPLLPRYSEQSWQRSPSLPVATSCGTTLYPRSQQSLQHPEPVSGTTETRLPPHLIISSTALLIAAASPSPMIHLRKSRVIFFTRRGSKRPA